MDKLSGVKENINILNSLNSRGNCICYMYGLFRFTEILNSAYTLCKFNVKCVHYMYDCLDMQKIWIPRTA